MKKNLLKKNFKKALAVLLISIMLFPILSIDAKALTGIPTIEAKKVIPITFDGKKADNLKVVNYSQKPSARKSSTQLGQSTLESVYDNRTHINSANQGPLDLCWTFGNKNLLESFLSKKLNKKERFSARHMDYALSNIVPGSLNRDPATGAPPLMTFSYFTANQGPVKEVNFPYNWEIEAKTQEDLNKNIENLYLEGYIAFPTIDKVIENGEMKYSVSDFKTLTKGTTEEFVLELRKEVKRHIKEYGSVSATTSSKSKFVMYPSEEFVYNEPGVTYKFDHNVSLVGWDDNFCANNPNGSTSGAKPINSGAWLVSDSNQPNGNQFYYIAFDDVFIEQILLGVNDVSLGKRFNVSRQDLIGANASVAYEALNTVGDPKISIINLFNKEDDAVEYLNKVSFMTIGKSSIEAYYIPREAIINQTFHKGGIKIGSTNIEHEHYSNHTLDVTTPISIPKGEYAIEIIITDHSPTSVEEGHVSVLAEILMDGVPLLENISYKDKSFILREDQLHKTLYNFPIRSYTSNEQLSNQEQFLVSFDLNGGSGDFPSVNVNSGSFLEISQLPTKKGYKFAGWTPDPKTTPITKDTTFVATWTYAGTNEEPIIPKDKPKNTATFVFGDGNIRYIKIGANGYIEEVPVPEAKAGYKFLGWNPDPKKTKATEDTVFYGLWEKLGLNDSKNTETEYTRGTKNDGTQANIRIPNAGKSITIVFVILVLSSAGVVFFVKYRRIDM